MRKYKILLSVLLGLTSFSALAAQEAVVANDGFPALERSYLKQVKRYDLNTVRMVDVGLNKDQIRALLGNPHFSEGIFVVRQWNYILDIQMPNHDDYTRCQLKIDFDDKGLAEKLAWKGEQCSSLKQSLNDVSKPEIKSGELTALLFKFNKYHTDDMLPESQHKLTELVDVLKSQSVRAVQIIGYADELGTDAYNNNLSIQRAKAIENYLVSHQVDPSILQISGRGADHQKSQCNVNNTLALKNCLQPNRRVEIHIQD